MTLEEFNNEFQFKYDAASNGGPDLNMYEKSLCLTQAVKGILDEAYKNFETIELSKRVIAPLIKYHECAITSIADNYTDLNCFLVSLPLDLQYVLREMAKTNNCNLNVKIENTKIDHLNNFLNNSFRRPNNRKVLKSEYNGTGFKIYTDSILEQYNITYIKTPSPIILSDLTLEPDLLGTESISNLTGPSTTELPEFIHDEIVDMAVVIAIKATRENNLQSSLMQ